MTEHWTIEQYHEYQRNKAMRDVPIKYRNTTFWADGVYWHSKGEHSRYCELKILEQAGKISRLKRQIAFVLQEKQPGIRGILFVVDFTYKENETKIAEDFKSPATRKLSAYRMKVKMFKAKYPDWVFRETMGG